VLPDRESANLGAWLREHSGVRIVCRDGARSLDGSIVQSVGCHQRSAALIFG
jgi:hypothetical protein